MSERKQVTINIHEALNAAHLARPKEFPPAYNLSDCCEYPELYIQYEADNTGRPTGPAHIFIGNGAGAMAKDAESEVAVLYRNGKFIVLPLGEEQ